MLTLKRLGIYLVTFLLTVTIVITLVNWKWLDKFLVNTANKNEGKENTLNKELVFVNVNKPQGGSEGEAFRQFRQLTVKLLNNIAAESRERRGPRGVLLDIWFSSDTTELENVKAALKQLKDLKVPVYASYNINEAHENIDLSSLTFEDVEPKHDPDIYSGLLAGSQGETTGSGRYHTFFYPEKTVANYENDIYLNSVVGDTVLIESLARKVASDLGNSTYIAKRGGSLVPYRSLKEISDKTFNFTADSLHPAGNFTSAQGNNAVIDMNKNILIAGDAENDLIDVGGRKIPGPYIVTWALSDLLENNSRLKLPIENLYVIIGQTLFFSLFTVLIFSVLFKYCNAITNQAGGAGGNCFCYRCTLLFCLF